jgi:hypothetical protein
VRCRSRTMTLIGASIGKMSNLSIIETCCGCFSWRRIFFVIGCCPFGCIDLLRWTNIILGVTLSLPWWGSFFHRLHQLVDVLLLYQDLLYGPKKLSLDDQQFLKCWGWVLNVIVIVVVVVVPSIICHLNHKGWWKDKIVAKMSCRIEVSRRID